MSAFVPGSNLSEAWSWICRLAVLGASRHVSNDV